MALPTLVLVVPCYNEARRLRPQDFLDLVDRHPSVSMLFVDDGSRDRTSEIVAGLARARPDRVRVYRDETNLGKSEAVRRGVLEALGSRPDLVGFWDADLATPLDAVDDFLRLASGKPAIELMLGSRVRLMGREIRRTAWRHVVGRVFAIGASLVLDLPVYDTQCGAKVFRVNDAVAQLFAVPFRSRWVFDVELLARYLDMPVASGAPPRAARIYELVLPAWHDVPGSNLRWSDNVRALIELGRVWRERRPRRARQP